MVVCLPLFVVTGASSGIGNAVAQSLVSVGCRVLAVARSTDRLAELQKRCGEPAQILTADLSTTEGINRVTEAVTSLGNISGIVHGAGSLITPTPYQELNAGNLLRDMAIHVTAPIQLNSALKKLLVGGRIVYIDSFSASNLRVGWSGYSVVKAAAQMAARAAAEEMTESSVIRVFPGAVNTPLVEAVLTDQTHSPTRQLFRELKANGQLTEPSEVGHFIADILVNKTDEQLNERLTWDINETNGSAF